jgi:adenine-specific DNA-methyltransferase
MRNFKMGNENRRFGPENPHPLSTIKTELVWEGKYDEYGNRRDVDIAGCAMPLQKIETIDEPRSRVEAQGKLFDSKSHPDDFRNMLIWGDNKLVMASLLREFRGKIDLIYIDPPFDVGADFSMFVPIGAENERTEKSQSTLELVAYNDIWGRGTDSYLHVMYERLALIKDLISERGTIWVHCDWHVGHMLRAILDEIFDKEHFINEIIWKRSAPKGLTFNRFPNTHDTLFFYAKSKHFKWKKAFGEYSEEHLAKYRYIEKETGHRYMMDNALNPNPDRPNLTYEWNGVVRTWRWRKERMQALHNAGRIAYSDSGVAYYKRYLEEMPGATVTDTWTDIAPVNSQPCAVSIRLSTRPIYMVGRADRRDEIDIGRAVPLPLR